MKLSEKSRSEGYISFDGQMNECFKGGDEIIIKASKSDLICIDMIIVSLWAEAWGIKDAFVDAEIETFFGVEWGI